MSDERTIEFPPRGGKDKYDLDDKLFSFFERREEIGQKKYGKGRQNAGYRRDNLMDVIEKVTDAITIINFAMERFEKAGDPMFFRDVKIGSRLVALRSTLVDAANETAQLRSDLNWSYPRLLKETVVRAVPLSDED